MKTGSLSKDLPTSMAIMYHYVRCSNSNLPFFRYLDIDNFRKQISWLKNNFEFPTPELFVNSCVMRRQWEGIVLTFDDGLSDHYHNVLPILKEHGLWGLFSLSTAPLTNNVTLDVHKIHLVVGYLGGVKAIRLLHDLIDNHMITIPTQQLEHFREESYKHQQSDVATKQFKQLLNYFIADEHRDKILEQLIEEAFGKSWPALSKDFYLNSDQIKELDSEGMIIGSHSVNHLVMSKLNETQQWGEITQSCDHLELLTGKKTSTFCYPYGGEHSFTKTTERLLADYGISISFNVDPRPITSFDLKSRPYALPRYDCNVFPYGESNLG